MTSISSVRTIDNTPSTTTTTSRSNNNNNNFFNSSNQRLANTNTNPNTNAARVKSIVNHNRLNSVRSSTSTRVSSDERNGTTPHSKPPLCSDNSSTPSTSLKAPNSYSNSNNSQSISSNSSSTSSKKSLSSVLSEIHSTNSSARSRSSREQPRGLADSKFMHPLRKASLGELNGVGVSRRSRSMSRDYENRGIVSSVLPGRKGSGFIATLGLAPLLDQSGHQFDPSYRPVYRVSPPATASFQFPHPSSNVPEGHKSKNVLSSRTTNEVLESLLDSRASTQRDSTAAPSSRLDRTRTISTPQLRSSTRPIQTLPPLPATPQRSHQSTPEPFSTFIMKKIEQNSPPRSGPMVLCETYTFPKPRIMSTHSNQSNYKTTFGVGQARVDTKGKGKEVLKEDNESQMEEINSLRGVMRENEESRLEREEWSREKRVRGRSMSQGERRSRSRSWNRGENGSGSDSEGGSGLFGYLGKRKKNSSESKKIDNSIPLATSFEPFSQLTERKSSLKPSTLSPPNEFLLTQSQSQPRSLSNYIWRPIRRQRSHSSTGIVPLSPVHPFDSLLSTTTTRYIGSKPIYHTRQSPSLDTVFIRHEEGGERDFIISNKEDPVRIPGQAFSAEFAIGRDGERRGRKPAEMKDLPKVPTAYEKEATLSMLLCDKLEAAEESITGSSSSRSSLNRDLPTTSLKSFPPTKSFSTSRTKPLQPPGPLPLSSRQRYSPLLAAFYHSNVSPLSSPATNSSTGSKTPPTPPPKSPNRPPTSPKRKEFVSKQEKISSRVGLGIEGNYPEEEMGVIGRGEEVTTPVTGGSYGSVISERSSVLQMDDDNSFKDLFFHPPPSSIIVTATNETLLHNDLRIDASPLHEAFFGEVTAKPIRFASRVAGSESQKENENLEEGRTSLDTLTGSEETADGRNVFGASNRPASSFIDFHLNEQEFSLETDWVCSRSISDGDGSGSFLDFKLEPDDTSTSFLDWSPLQSPMMSTANTFFTAEEGSTNRLDQEDGIGEEEEDLNATISEARRSISLRQVSTSSFNSSQFNSRSTSPTLSFLQPISVFHPLPTSPPPLPTHSLQVQQQGSSPHSTFNNSSRFNSPRISSWSSNSNPRWSGIDRFPNPPVIRNDDD